jgi:hypothetical protein
MARKLALPLEAGERAKVACEGQGSKRSNGCCRESFDTSESAQGAGVGRV